MKTNSTILEHSAILIFFLLFFALVYWPATQGHYLYGEDYVRIWTSGWKVANEQSYVSYTHYIPVEGRPLEVLYYYLIFNKFINSLKSYEAINAVRIIGIIGIGLLAYVLYLIFKAIRFGTGHAVLLSILICTLPPIQNYIGRMICIVFIYCVLLSAIAALVLFKTVFYPDRLNKVNILIVVPVSMVLFIAALCIYQPAALTYWAFLIIPLIMAKNEDFLKKWRLPFAVYFCSGFVSMIIYFRFIKIFYLLLNIKLQERATLVKGFANIYHKLVWFINYPLYSASNLWNIVPLREVALFAGILIISGCLIDFKQSVSQATDGEKRRSLFWNFLFKYLLVLIVIPMSFLAHLITEGHGGTYAIQPHHRVLIGLEIVLIMMVYRGVLNIAEFLEATINFSNYLNIKIITVGLIILAGATSYSANRNVDIYFAGHHTNEYRYVREVIEGYGVHRLSNDTKIFVKWFDQETFKKLSVRYGEYFHVSLPGDLIRFVLYELGIKSDIPIIRIDDPELINGSDMQVAGDNNLMIDMNKIRLNETYRLSY